jgi:superfamily I DNA/RNA helicase
MVLSDEQKKAVGADGNVVVTACPGSGKTRVLTYRVLRGLEELKGNKQRVIALTFTNRAADEIQHRLENLNVPTECLWSGTIHAFALEWILKPYAPYCPMLRMGFSVADEHYTQRLIDEAKKTHNADQYLDICTARPRDGNNPNHGIAAKVFDTYKEKLHAEKLLDYDDVLSAAYSILNQNQEISETLAAIMPLICVDEVQDIQDMQYAILSQIVKGGSDKNSLFFVGDSNQSIYESLGALTKSPEQIAAEFGLPEIKHLKLSENYRSTQRMVDYFTLFRPQTGAIKSLASYADTKGQIKFFNQSVSKDALPKFISQMVKKALDSGVIAADICVIAPRWFQVTALARSLIANLPDIDFDAPGLSPLHSNRDDVWFKLARLFLSGARHGLDRTRHRWAGDFVASFETVANVALPERLRENRGLLRFINSTTSVESDGVPFLKDVFGQFLKAAAVDLDTHAVLLASHTVFFQKAESRIKTSEGGMPTTVEGLKKLFKSPAGVVVSTCHGVKGEEYHTVIALGLLRGFVPHWSTIYDQPDEADEQASKLLYVVCSRAKQDLFLIAESGRLTQTRKPYVTTEQLAQVKFKYDA